MRAYGFLIVASSLVAMAALGGCPSKKPKTPVCGGNGDCKDGLACIAKQCQQCSGDSDCGPNQQCKAGACVAKADEPPPDPRKPCKTDDECAEDEDCSGGHCTKSSASTPPPDACPLTTVYFAFDSSNIEGTERDHLDADGACLEKESAKNFLLIGHTDQSGTEEYNIALSERRAKSVADYLSRLGIDPARMQVVPKGKTDPSGEGDDKDRRVELQWH